MKDHDHEDDIAILGDAIALTRGDWMPSAIETFIHPDHYDIP